jgi:DNA polymerase (family 10)
MNKHDLARIFNEIGLLLELKGDNPFKTRAYYNAARTLENLNEDLSALIREDRLGDIPGFGEAIVKKITEWSTTGTIEYYENLKAATPPGLLEFLRIPGLGPKKINQIYRELGISSIEELEKACLEHKIAGLAGFGAKTQEKILAGIHFAREHQGQYLWLDAWTTGLKLKNELEQNPAVLQIGLAGSLRRFKETVHDIDILAATDNPSAVADSFVNLALVDQVTARGDTKISVILKSGIGADLRLVKPSEYPHAFQHFTGSKEHNTALRHLAKEQGLKVNEYGLFPEGGDESIVCRDEAEIYQKLGLSYIPPELREDLGEIQASQSGRLPVLVEPDELKGIFHVHTTYSDGVNTLREMVEACIEKGFSYVGIADHSQAAAYARGLTVDTLQKQFHEIDALNREFPRFRIFKGIEADILPSGELDYSPEILAQFDFVVGSIHSQFRMSKEEMTARVLKALDSPYVTILGHPTGRILLERTGYELDMEKVLGKAAEKGVVIEFNANPFRLDLDWRWCRKTKELGALIAVNPDAHSIGELDLARSGVLVARKGWLEAKDVLNTRSAEEVERLIKQLKV